MSVVSHTWRWTIIRSMTTHIVVTKQNARKSWWLEQFNFSLGSLMIWVIILGGLCFSPRPGDFRCGQQHGDKTAKMSIKLFIHHRPLVHHVCSGVMRYAAQFAVWSEGCHFARPLQAEQ